MLEAREDGLSRRNPFVTVDNAIKIADGVWAQTTWRSCSQEGVAGSIENFADQMNGHARRIGRKTNQLRTIQNGMQPTTR